LFWRFVVALNTIYLVAGLIAAKLSCASEHLVCELAARTLTEPVLSELIGIILEIAINRLPTQAKVFTERPANNPGRANCASFSGF